MSTIKKLLTQMPQMLMAPENEGGQQQQEAQAAGTIPSAGNEQQTNNSSTPSDSDSTDLGSDDPAKAAATTDLGGDDEAAKDEAAKPAFFGAPEGDATYEDFTLPGGAVADAELKGSFSALAKELGLNQAGAQKLVDYKAELDKVPLRQWAEHVLTLKTEAKADPDIGGAKYDAAVAAGRSVIAKFGGTPAQQAELKAVMNQYGVGAHRAMIRFFANVAKATGETPTGGGGPSSTSVQKPLHEIFYGDSRSSQGS